MCPNVEGIDYDESGYEDNMRCPTGCVATALAQLMHYWQWPKTCPALDGYVTATNGFKMKALPATIFKWDKIRTSYLEAETGEAADAVAELMRYCGQAVHMDYRYREAGASLRGKEWVELFDFSQAAQCIQRDSYSQKEWEHIVYDELSNGHPVLYSGTDEEGHQFIIDGYDGQGLFHINWGWGEYDGYFVLSVADPYRRGDDSGYRYDQEAWIGVQPAHGSVVASPYVVLSDDGQTVTFYYDEHRVNRGGIAINETKYAKSAYSSIVSAAFDASFANYHPTSTAAWFCECRNLKDITGMEYLNTEYVTDMSCMFMYCKSLTSLDLSRFKTEKVKDIYYMFFFCSSLTTIYANEDLWSMGSVTESSNMFLGCTNLVGGNGTAFSSDNTDATYARVDKEDAPGYLTNRTANGITPVISKREPESYYLLDGRMANQKAARKGIYIANGRKVMVK